MSDICIKLHYLQYINNMGFEEIIIAETIDDEQERDKIISHKDIHCLKAYLREIGWSEYNNDKEQFTEYQPFTNTYELNVFKLLEYEFKKLLKYVEDNGKRIDITPQKLEDIHPKIANYIITELSKEMSVNSEELRDLAHNISNFYSDKKNASDLKHIPSEAIEVELADRFGWTIKEIEGISIQKMEKLLVVLNQKSNQERNQYNRSGYDNILDEKEGIKLIGSDNMKQKTKDVIAHRIKKR